MNSKQALAFVERIEAHRIIEDGIWDEIRATEGYKLHQDNDIRSIIEERKRAKVSLEDAAMYLSAFDEPETD